jgi:hypothetical protein
MCVCSRGDLDFLNDFFDKLSFIKAGSRAGLSDKVDSSRLHSVKDIAGERADNDYLDVSVLGNNFTQKFVAPHSGHFHVKRDNIRLQCGDFIGSLNRVAKVSDNFDRGIPSDLTGNKCSEEQGIIDNH